MNEVIEGARLFGHAEAAVSGDPIDTLHEQLFAVRSVHRGPKHLLEMNGHEQVACSMHRQHGPLNPAVERHEFVVRPGAAPHGDVGRFSTDHRVQLVARKAEGFIDSIAVGGVGGGAVRWRLAPCECRATDVLKEAGAESLRGEGTGTTAQLDFDAGESSSSDITLTSWPTFDGSRNVTPVIASAAAPTAVK